MKRIKCPFCEFDIAASNDFAAVRATITVIDHAEHEHPGQGVFSKRPGHVISLEDHLKSKNGEPIVEETPKPAMATTVALTAFPRTEDESRTVYQRFAHVAGNLVTDGYDFSLSHNQFDPGAPLPPAYEDPYAATQEHLSYDDETMVKVVTAVRLAINRYEPAQPFEIEMADDIINQLQNAGIVFRERA